MKQSPNSFTLQMHSNWGRKRGLEAQTRDDRQGDFPDTAITVVP